MEVKTVEFRSRDFSVVITIVKSSTEIVNDFNSWHFCIFKVNLTFLNVSIVFII